MIFFKCVEFYMCATALYQFEPDLIGGSGDMVKKGQIGVPERFFEKISRNMTDTEKMKMTNIIGNFADNIVYEMKVLAHHPKALSLEIWEFTNFHQVS